MAGLDLPAGKAGVLHRSESVTLDAAGAGEITFGPVPASQVWVMGRLAVFCTDDDPMPTALVGRNGSPATPANLIDGTYTGAQDFSDMASEAPMESGEFLIVRWTGGQAAAVATAVLSGRQVVVG